MKTALRARLAALAAVLLLASCGGSDETRFQALVSFGDSLSDVGSYRTAGIAAIGGGRYTVNGPGPRVWVEQLASQLGLPAPCAAQTGLNASGAFAAFAEPVANHPGCTAYGQGGARASDPIGPWNAALLDSPDPDTAFSGRELTDAMTRAFNQALAEGLEGLDGALLVDLYQHSSDQAARPADYGHQLFTQRVAQALAQAGWL